MPPADGHDTTGQVEPDAHGHGPVQVSLPGFKTELDDRVIASANLLGGRFAYNEDINAGNTLGIGTRSTCKIGPLMFIHNVGYIQNSVGDGTRSSAATSYLQPVIDRPNLDVMISTRVTRVFGSKDPLAIDSIEIATAEDGGLQILLEGICSSRLLRTPNDRFSQKRDCAKWRRIWYVWIR